MQYNLFDTTTQSYNPYRDIVSAQEVMKTTLRPYKMLADVEKPEEVSFGQTVSASLGYTYNPVIDYISQLQFDEEARDPNYNPFADMEGFSGYEEVLKDAVNADHMKLLKKQLRRNLKNRRILSNAGIGKQIIAGIFDPINILPLPFGSIGKTVATSAFRTGASVGVLSAGTEALRYTFDPLATGDEVVGNIAIATIGGAILGGAIGGVNKLRVRKAQKEIETEIKDFNNLADDVAALNRARDNADTSQRPLAGAKEQELLNEQATLPNSLEELQSLKEKLRKDDLTWIYDQEGPIARAKLADNNEILKERKRLINQIVNQNKGLTKKAKDTVKFLEGIKATRDKFAEPLLKIKEDLLAQAKGEKGLNIGLSKGQVDFLKKILKQEKELFLTKKQTAIIKKKIKEVEVAQKRIDANMRDLINKNKGVRDIISLDKVKEIQAENIKLNKEIGHNNNLQSVVKQEQEMIDEIGKVNTELTIRRSEDEAMLDADGVPIDKFKLQPNWYTDNFVYKALVTPMKKVFQSKELPLAVKNAFSKLANDAGLTQVAHKLGATLGMSVYTRAAVRNGEYVQAHDALRALYAEHTGKNMNVMDIDFQKKGYHEWLEDTYSRVLKQEKLSDLDKRVKTIVDDFMNRWEKRLRDQGLIGSSQHFTVKITQENIRLQNYVKKLREILDPEVYAKRTGKQAKLYSVTEEARQLEKDFIAFTRGEVVDLAKLNKTLDKLEKFKISGIRMKRVNDYKNDRVIPEIRKIQEDLKMLKDNLELSKKTKVTPNNEEFFFPRYWDIAAIKANRADFESKLIDWYTNNPTILKKNKDGTLERVEALTTAELQRATDPVGIAKRVKATVDTIIKERVDVTDDAIAFYGHGKSKHFRHRTLDIPNKFVTDYIVRNPVQVMKIYTQRVAGRYEFSKQFGGRSVDQVIADLELDMFNAGQSIAKMNEVRKDFLHMYDRVAGRVLRNPDRFDQRFVNMLKDLAQLNYLGSAGFSTLPDLAKVLMEHDLGNVMKGLQGILQNSKVRMNAREGRLAGEILEILQGDVHMRLIEDLQNNPLSQKKYDIAMSKVRNVFYLLNGLAPATNLMKKLDSVIRTHELIDFAVKDAKGVAKAKDIEYLRRYNIDKKKAQDIKKLVDDGVIENTKPNGSGVYLGNSEKWLEAGVPEETLDTFRGALNNGIMNTILMGTPADKPIIADGVVYIPQWIGNKFGLKSDKRFKGYTRIETGLAGLPFQFWSYSFAAANKITAAMMTGQAKNRAAAFVVATGLGYMSLAIKSQFGSDFVSYKWDNMPAEDKFARSIDASGLLAMYSDLFYTAMNTSMALGGPDISGGLLQPKFPQEKNFVDALTAIGGAGPAIGVDITRGLYDFAIEGKYGEGSRQVIKNLPYMRLWFIKGIVNELTSVLVDIEDDGFERAMRTRF